MAKQRRRFSREFKMEAVGRVLEGDRSLTSIAREIGVSNVVLTRWRDSFLREGAFGGNDESWMKRFARFTRRAAVPTAARVCTQCYAAMAFTAVVSVSLVS